MQAATTTSREGVYIPTFVHVIAALALHLLGDYVVQRLTWGIVPSKHASMLGMLIHSIIAEGLASVYIGYAVNGVKGAIYGFIIGVLSHYIIDTIGAGSKSIVQSMIDQGLHTASLCAVSVFASL